MTSIVFFHSPLLMKIALDARDRTIHSERETPIVPFSDDALVAIVMASAAAEAFINELTAVYSSDIPPLEPAEVATGSALATIENDRGSTELKYLVASLTLSGVAFERGGPPFQDFATLMKMRNDLMHARPRDDVKHTDGTYVSVPPAYIRDFEQRGMTSPRAPGVSVSWLNSLQSGQMATWACWAALYVIVALIRMKPASSRANIHAAWIEYYEPRARRPP